MFFLRRTRPLELTAGRMRALRLSLNTPVVATQDLPVGPARAAIAIHAEARGGLAVTVGVRSLTVGASVLYGLEGAVAPRAAQEAMDAALSFAEGMGFLFDDELVGDDTASQEKALVRWHEAIGAAESLAAADAESELGPAPLELFERGGRDLTDPPVPAGLPPTPHEIESPAAPAFDASAGEPAPDSLAFQAPDEEAATLPLTKFRLHADTSGASQRPGVPEAPRPPTKRALGRVRLERRRSNQQVRDARRSWLLRLLTSF